MWILLRAIATRWTHTYTSLATKKKYPILFPANLIISLFRGWCSKIGDSVSEPFERWPQHECTKHLHDPNTRPISPHTKRLRSSLRTSRYEAITHITRPIPSACPRALTPPLPALEDTFILLDALEQDADELKRLRPFVCLEVGWVNPPTRQ